MVIIYFYYLDEVGDSDVYVGILGEKYGSVGKDTISPTEAEFRVAKKLDKDILIYVKGQSSVDKDREAGVKKIIKEKGPLSLSDLKEFYPDIAEKIHSI